MRAQLSAPDLFLRGDVQVLQARVEQEVLVDVVAGVARRSAVHLGVVRQVHLQHLDRTDKARQLLHNR